MRRVGGGSDVITRVAADSSRAPTVQTGRATARARTASWRHTPSEIKRVGEVSREGRQRRSHQPAHRLLREQLVDLKPGFHYPS